MFTEEKLCSIFFTLFIQFKKTEAIVQSCSENSCSEKLCKIHKKTPAMDSQVWNFTKNRTPRQVLELHEVSQNSYSIEHLRTEATTVGVLLKKMFLKISQNSQENICVRASFLMKL